MLATLIVLKLESVKGNDSGPADGPAHPTTGSFWTRLALSALFSLPLGYTGMILAVATHEVLGHGLAARFVGGDFHGFVLRWDGMGWAFAAPATGAPASHRIVVLGAGILLTTVIGIALLAAGWALRERLFLRWTALVLAACFLLDGAPYLFWSALSPSPAVGDAARIIELSESSVVRWSLISAGAVLTVASTFLPIAMFFGTVEQWLGAGNYLQQRQRVAALLLLVLAPGAAGWFLLDWNQLVPGIGLWPPFCGVMLLAALSAWLYRRPARAQVVGIPLSAVIWPTAWCWSAAAIVLAAVLMWLGDGVRWS